MSWRLDMVRSAGCMCVRGSMLDHATLADAWANGLAGQWLFQQARPWCHHVSPVLPASQRCSTRSMSQLLEVPQARSRVAFNFLLSKVLYTQTTRPNHPPRGHLPVLWLPRARAGALQRREEGAALGACRAVQSDQVEPGALEQERMRGQECRARGWRCGRRACESKRACGVALRWRQPRPVAHAGGAKRRRSLQSKEGA